jgi:hypothetical protein
MWRTAVVVFALTAGCRPPFDPAEAAQVQSSALAVGAPVPGGQLTGASNARVELAELARGHDQTVVVFYRGFY